MSRHALPSMLAALAVLLPLTFGGSTSTAFAVTDCTLYAAPGGSDASAGSQAAPFATPQKLVASLGPGDTGCLRAGIYIEDVKVSRSGAPSAPVTLRSYPGERAKLVGRLWIAQGADHVTIADLDLDGTNARLLPSPTVNAADTTFRGNDVTNNHTAICFNLGSATYGRAVRTLIEDNRIHNCGVLPAANHDHGIYVVASTDATIRGNVIFDNADRGIQLYPDAQRTTIVGNIIDGNGQGVIFSGAAGVASNDNVVEHNVITNSVLRYNVESWYPAGNPIGTGNRANANCTYGGARGATNGGVMTPHGYEAYDNVIADPQYANRSTGDFRVSPDSPCAAVLNGVVESQVAAGSPEASSPAPCESCAPGSPSTPSTTSSLQPAKLEVARSGVLQGRALDVLAPITRRASGQVDVDFHAAGRHTRFQAPVNAQEGHVRFRRDIPRQQARMGTGIITLTYPGNERTHAQEVRLRAASGRAQLDVERPSLADGLLRAHGTISSRARGVVRVQLTWATAGEDRSVELQAPIRDGRFNLDDELPPEVRQSIARRDGTVHSYTLFTGYLPARMRGEMQAYEVLGTR